MLPVNIVGETPYATFVCRPQLLYDCLLTLGPSGFLQWSSFHGFEMFINLGIYFLTYCRF